VWGRAERERAVTKTNAKSAQPRERGTDEIRGGGGARSLPARKNQLVEINRRESAPEPKPGKKAEARWGRDKNLTDDA